MLCFVSWGSKGKEESHSSHEKASRGQITELRGRLEREIFGVTGTEMAFNPIGMS